MNRHDAIKEAKMFLKEIKNDTSFENLEHWSKSKGYSIVLFNTPDGDEILRKYDIPKPKKACTYITNTVKLILIDEKSTVQLKHVYLLHEIGHIRLHLNAGAVIMKDKEISELEADAFTYTALNGKKRQIQLLIAVFTLIVMISLFGMSYYLKMFGNDELKGIEQASSYSGDVVEEITVYVNPYGTKYHKPECQYVKENSIKTTLEKAEKRYSPCSICYAYK